MGARKAESMSRHAFARITPTATFHVDEATGDVVAMSGGKEKGRLLREHLRDQGKLLTWKRKNWINDGFMLAVLRSRDFTPSSRG
jgi:hypothetical protein